VRHALQTLAGCSKPCQGNWTPDKVGGGWGVDDRRDFLMLFLSVTCLLNSLRQGLDDSLLNSEDIQHMIFKASINQLIQVTDPAARAIVCLESPHSSAADVFVFVAGALLLTRKNIETMMKSSLPLDLPKDAIFRDF